MDINEYKVPEEAEIRQFFKKNPFSKWQLAEFFEWEKNLNPS
jgi:hypothetical protein